MIVGREEEGRKEQGSRHKGQGKKWISELKI
jgi:hypothetical protein